MLVDPMLQPHGFNFPHKTLTTMLTWLVMLTWQKLRRPDGALTGATIWHASTHPEPNSNTESTLAKSAACSRAPVAGPAYSQNQATESEEIEGSMHVSARQ